MWGWKTPSLISFSKEALSEAPGNGDEEPLQPGRLPGLVPGKESPHLAVQPFIGEWIGCELVSQKTANHLLGKDNRVQCHAQPSFTSPFVDLSFPFLCCFFRWSRTLRTFHRIAGCLLIFFESSEPGAKSSCGSISPRCMPAKYSSSLGSSGKNCSMASQALSMRSAVQSDIIVDPP